MHKEESSRAGFFKGTKKHRTLLQSDSYVTVRIWLSTVDGVPTNAKNAIIKGKKGQRFESKGDHEVNVGHVSLETPTNYISFWPGETPNSINKVVRSAHHDLERDVTAEGHEPNLVIQLYSLDVAAVDAGFDEIVQQDTGWVLTGDSSLTDGEGHSCVSLAHSLLRRGQIEKLQSALDASNYLVVNPLMTVGLTSPNEFARYVEGAKRNELKKYPETNSFDDNEISSKRCCIM